MAIPTQAMFESIEVSNTFDSYPDKICDKLLELRQLLFETAMELDINDLEETLKWGEPSYLTKTGSTIRLAWKKSNPQQYGIFLNCKTSLVETIKEIYRDKFMYEGNRAIIFNVNDPIPIGEVKTCLGLSLNYHNIKHLPMLGM